MIRNKLIFLLFVFISFIYAKPQPIIFNVYNFDNPKSKIKKINYQLQDSDGNVIMEGKLKKGFLKKNFKLKYDFNSVECPEQSIIYGKYNLVLSYVIDGDPYQNVLQIRKAWYADLDYVDYGTIDGEIEQERETKNKVRNIYKKIIKKNILFP